MINYFAFISLFSFITCICLAVYVYFKNVLYVYNNKKEKLFVLLCLSLAFCWALIEFGYRSASNFETADLWLKLNVSWYFVLSFLLHFILIYTENYKYLKKRRIYFFIYGPAIIFCLLDSTTSLLYTQPVKLSWGWSYGFPENAIIYTVSSSWAAIIGILCLIIIIRYVILKKIFKTKYSQKYGLIGLIIPIMIGLNTEYLFPLIKISMPELIVPELTLGFIILWYSTWVYHPINKEEKYCHIRSEVDKLFSIQRF
jgi:hypothetical protein